MTHRFSRRLIGYVLGPALAIAVPLCAAAGPARSTGAAKVSHLTQQVQDGWMSPDANPSRAWLYVAGANDVTIYNLGRNSSPQIGRVKQGIRSPGGIALDPDGTLYVPNENSATITVYPPGAKVPSLTLTGTSAPESVALDASGNVYVANRGSNPGISVYAAGQTTPSQYITSPLLRQPDQVAFDSAGTLYITDNVTGVSFLTPGPSPTVTSLGLSDYGVANGIAIDPVTGNLLVGSSTEPPCLLSLFLPGQKTPARQITVNYGGLDFMSMGFVRKKEVVFVPNSQGNFVDAFKPSLKGDPVLTVPTSSLAISVAFKPAGVP
jgi:hypothetical protein